MSGCSSARQTPSATSTPRSCAMAGSTTSSRSARTTTQLVFERVMFEHGEELTTTADVLRGIAQTRRTLTPEMVAQFEQDIQDYARLSARRLASRQVGPAARAWHPGTVPARPGPCPKRELMPLRAQPLGATLLTGFLAGPGLGTPGD